ncbi:MAG: septum formation initiator family protein [Candidatus Yonathbacteria bacterium]|nr:septum formation initiator family protein [Candidatus Yonathbacteria bacterium]
MVLLHEKKKFHQILYSRPTLLLLAVLLVAMLNSTWKMYEKASLAREQKNRLEKDLQELKTRELDLEAKIANLKTARGLEEEIRGRFSVAKNGESVVVVVDPSSGEGTSTQDGSGIGGLWHKFLRLFGGQ